MQTLFLLLLCVLVYSWTPTVSAADYDKKTPQTAEQIFAPSAQKDFYITTVHIDGNTNVQGDASHPPEPFPTSALPAGGGIILQKPDDKGNWKVRSFVFQPSQIVVHQGDTVALHFLGVQGPSHTIAVEGHAEQVVLRRGEMQTVTFVAETAGIIRFASLQRQPTMQGQIIVLPRE